MRVSTEEPPALASSEPGQAVYSPLVLAIYDWYVLGLSCRAIWRCPASRLLAHYRDHVGARHLDVGVGSGYFLDRSEFPTPQPEITLFDLNANSLRYASKRIARYRPSAVLGDALEPNHLPLHHFDSIALNFFFHCLPDGGRGKWRLLDHFSDKLAAGGRLFGSTILGRPTPPNPMQRRLMAVYNRKGIFSNTQDDLSRLRHELEQRFDQVCIEQVGVVALFGARARVE